MTQSGPWHTLMTRCTRLFLLDTSDARLPGYSILQSHQGAKTACHRHRRSVPAEAGWKWPACTHGCTTRPASQHALCLAAPASSAATRIYEPPSRSRNARTTTTTTRVRREKRNGKEEGGGGRRRRKEEEGGGTREEGGGRRVGRGEHGAGEANLLPAHDLSLLAEIAAGHHQAVLPDDTVLGARAPAHKSLASPTWHATRQPTSQHPALRARRTPSAECPLQAIEYLAALAYIPSPPLQGRAAQSRLLAGQAAPRLRAVAGTGRPCRA